MDNNLTQKQDNIPTIDLTVIHKKHDYEDTRNQTKGHFSDKRETIGIINGIDTIAIIEISEPIVVSVADKDYPWGWFQFPTMGVNDNGIISVQWSMKNDSAEDYGDDFGRNNTKISLDNGKTWQDPTNDINIPAFREQVRIGEGEIIAISTQESEDISLIEKFPPPIFSYGEKDFYYERDLPDKYKGIYVNYFTNNVKRTIHAKVENDDLIRYSDKGLISTFWFGKLAIKNKDLYACVYPSYYEDSNGNLNPSAISFYKSSDLGESWILKGVINYQTKKDLHSNANFNNDGFTEPTFEFLKDGSVLCVMRTSEGNVAPMYKSYSYDYGENWTDPEPITPNGVMPQLIRLDQNILVMASGRPGIQLRISCDGKGEEWTYPIELIDYDEDKNWVNDTCGYPFVYKKSENEVFIVYSNFKNRDSMGEIRKSINFRKIKVYKI